MCRYVCKFPQGAIRFWTGIPDHKAIFGATPIKYDWMETVCGIPIEELPDNAPVMKGNPVCTTTYADANLLHDLTTGRSATGILHFFNQTPIDAFSKQQNQVESVTYGSEFMAARQAVEQIIDLCYTLHMFSVPIDGPPGCLVIINRSSQAQQFPIRPSINVGMLCPTIKSMRLWLVALFDLSTSPLIKTLRIS